jgi:hypothetical protein
MPERVVITVGAGFAGSRSTAAHPAGASVEHRLAGLDPVRCLARQLARA